MNKLAVYTNISTNPLIIECEQYSIDNKENKLYLYNQNNKVAVFNFENIIGFVAAENDPLYKLKNENAFLKDDIAELEARLKHLLQSNLIRLYDTRKDGEYLYDITELDEEYKKI